MTSAPVIRTGLGRPLVLTIVTSVALMGAIIVWSLWTPLSGAVVAPGQVVVNGNPRGLQHVDGGTVSEIHASNGDRVAAGQVLLTLDATLLRAKLDVTRAQLAASLALHARLEAEEQDLGPVTQRPLTVPPVVEGVLAPEDLAGPVAGQARIQMARAAVLTNTRERLTERGNELRHVADGTRSLVAAQEEQLAYLTEQSGVMEMLDARGLTTREQVMQHRMEVARVQGELATSRASLAGNANERREAELEILQAEQEFHEDIVTELRETTDRIEELVLEVVSLGGQIDRTVLRAPVSGIVHEFRIASTGAVVTPGDTIGQIIPLDDGVEFEVKVEPRSIDQVYPGQAARLRFSSLDPRTTPEPAGTVKRVSPDSITDEVTQERFYRATVEISAEELAGLERAVGGAAMVPGMPVQALLETRSRTAFGWVVGPFVDQVGLAFREE